MTISPSIGAAFSALLAFVFCAANTKAALPSPWQTQDVGAVATAGSASESGGIFTVAGSGEDIWNVVDEFRFVYQVLSGDCTLTARIQSVQNTDPWAKAGLMVRQTLSANSPNVLIAVSPSHGITFQSRSIAGDGCTFTAISGLSAPYWVRLVRYGNTLTGYRSVNGTDWSAQSSATINMGDQVYAGVAVTSHLDGQLCSSMLTDVSVAPGGFPAPAAPTGLAGYSENGNIILNWNAAGGATNYRVKRAVSSSAAYSLAGTVSSPGYTDSGLTPGSTYYYVVSAITPAGESNNSSQVAVILYEPPNPPVDGAEDPNLFTGPAAAPAPELFANRAQVEAAGISRVLTVEERVGEERRTELVRAPLFFHAGECADANAWVIVPAEGGSSIPYQVDDVRRDSSGNITRMHAYFFVDSLQPWEQRQFHLKPGSNPATLMAPLPITQLEGIVTLQGQDMKVSFFSAGNKGGAIAAIEPTVGTVILPDGYVAPKVKLARQDAALNVIRENTVTYGESQSIEIRDLRWASGPLFAKLMVRTGPGGQPDNAEFTYLIPKHGSYFSQIEKAYHSNYSSTETSALRDNEVLRGRIQLGGGGVQSIVRVPVGLREHTRSTYSAYNDALVNAGAGISMLPVPYTQPGYRGIRTDTDPSGTLRFLGGDSLIRKTDGNSAGLKVFWGQMNYYFTSATTQPELWRETRRASQTLTAVVDEPWATKEVLYSKMAGMADRFNSIQNWNPSWRQKIFIAYLRNQLSTIPTLLDTSTTTSPGTDPYNLTYGVGGYVLAAAQYKPQETKFHDMALKDATSSRNANAVVDPYHFPRINSFAYAFNMHMGTYLLGLYGGQTKNDASMVKWVSDCLGNPAIKAVYGRGQRPYGVEVKAVEQSDVLYQSVSDDYFRAIEVVSNEDLSIPPSVYGRYWDTVDVNSDIYQAAAAVRDPNRQPYGYDRAMMFRAQTSDHRWETWTAGAVPYVGLMAPTSKGATVGLTEAIYYTHYAAGGWLNWADCGPLFTAFITLRQLMQNHSPPPLAPLPSGVQISRSGSNNVITWTPAPGTIAGYRIYRAAQAGGPWTWLNSPYKTAPGQLVTGGTYTDSGAPVDSMYLVTAEDLNGRESDWFPEEPCPTTDGKRPAPRVPRGVIGNAAGANVNLTWSPGSYAESYKVKRSTSSNGVYTTIASGVTGHSLADTGLTLGSTYHYVVSAVIGNQESPASAAVSVAVGAQPVWQSTDIGGVAATGSLAISGSTFTVTGSGADIWNNADEFQFVYRMLSGDCILTARVNSIQNTNSWAKAGVMIRESLAANSINAATILSYSNGVAMQRRTGTGGVSTNTKISGAVAPSWVRISRVGNTLAGHHSANGTNWTQIYSMTLSMASQVYVGLAVTSHNDGVRCAAVFDNIYLEAPSLALPSAPSGLKIEAGDGSATLQWNAVSNATSYRVKRSMVSGGPYAAIRDVSATAAADTGLANGATYYYVVTGLNANGEGSPSLEFQLDLPVPEPGPEESREPRFSIAAGSVYLTTWTSVNGRTYQLQKSVNLADWTNAGAPQPGNGTPLQFQVLMDADAPRMFYRILGSSVGQKVATVPVGYFTIQIAAGSISAPKLTSFSLPLRSPLLEESAGDLRGQIASVTANTISNSNIEWIPGALSQSGNPYFLRIMSGSAMGRNLQISSSVPNSGSTVTVLNEGTDLTTLGIAAGDDFLIYPGRTLLSLFGEGTQTGANSVFGGMSGDLVRIFDGSVWNEFHYNLTVGQWRKGSVPVNMNNVVIRPDAGILYTRKAGAEWGFTIFGVVPEISQRIVYSTPGASFFSLGFPTDSTLVGARFNEIPGWVSKTPGNTLADTDKIEIFDGVSWSPYHYDASLSQWRKGSVPVNMNSLLIPAGRPILLNKRAGPAGKAVLLRALPYELD